MADQGELAMAAPADAESSALARARALASLIARDAPAADARRRLTLEIEDALHDGGFFRLLAPRWLGGAEMAPSAFVAVVEALAIADASTAWCVAQTGVCAVAAAYLDPAAAREIFGPPRALIAWGTTRDAKAVQVEGGYRVSGSWTFGSGLHHATWLGGHCPIVDADGRPVLGADGRPRDRTVLFAKSSAQVTDVWSVLGLRATGSDSYAVDNLFVPEAHTLLTVAHWPDETRLGMTPPYRFSVNGLYAPAFAGVALGNARGMLEAFITLARDKKPMWRRDPLGHEPLVQLGVAEAEARLGAARAYLFEAITNLEDAAMATGALPADLRIKLRGASTFAIRATTKVTQDLYAMAGTTALFDADAHQRRFRDAHAIAQHHQGRTAHLEAVGKHLLGLETDLRFA
jgi:alkylation response protein AidB-like acyl-CoA dehydrogenase